MTEQHERVDLAPLDAAADPLRYERWVRALLDAADPELARRARQAGPLALVVRWARPTLAAAAVVTVLALGALAATDRRLPLAATTVEEAGVPDPAAEWLESGREPTASDLVLAMERR